MVAEQYFPVTFTRQTNSADEGREGERESEEEGRRARGKARDSTNVTSALLEVSSSLSMRPPTQPSSFTSSFFPSQTFLSFLPLTFVPPPKLSPRINLPSRLPFLYTLPLPHRKILENELHIFWPRCLGPVCPSRLCPREIGKSGLMACFRVFSAFPDTHGCPHLVNRPAVLPRQ